MATGVTTPYKRDMFGLKRPKKKVEDTPLKMPFLERDHLNASENTKESGNIYE